MAERESDQRWVFGNEPADDFPSEGNLPLVHCRRAQDQKGPAGWSGGPHHSQLHRLGEERVSFGTRLTRT